MKTVLRKLFGASAGVGVAGGLFVLALAGLMASLPNTAHAAHEDWVGWQTPAIAHATATIRYTANGIVAAGESFALGATMTLRADADYSHEGSWGVAQGITFWSGSGQAEAQQPKAAILLVKESGKPPRFRLSKGDANVSAPPAAIGAEYDATPGAEKSYALLMEYDAASDTLSASVNGVSLGKIVGFGVSTYAVREALWGCQSGGNVALTSVTSGYAFAGDERFSTTPAAQALATTPARYLRVTFTKWIPTTSGEYGNGVAIAEFRVLSGGRDVTPSGTAVSGTAGIDDGTALSKLLDGTWGSQNKWWVRSDQTGEAASFTYDFGSAISFDSYLMGTADQSYRNPIAWKVELSQDGEEWKLWDVRDLGTESAARALGANARLWYGPNVAATGLEGQPERKAWRYLRYTTLRDNGGDYPAFGEMRLLLGNRDVTPQTVSVTGSSTPSDCGWGNLFNKNVCYYNANQKAWASGANATFTADLGRAVAFDGYSVELADHGPRNPIAWKVEVSNDNATWEMFDAQDFGDINGASTFWGAGSTTSTNAHDAGSGLYPVRTFTTKRYGEPGLTGRSVSFVLGACGSSGADLAGGTLYGMAPYQVPGTGWNNLAPTSNAKGGSFTLSEVRDNLGSTVEGASFAVNKHGEVASITVNDSSRTDTTVTSDYCLLPSGGTKMAVFKENPDGEDSFVFTGVPYKKFAVVLYLGQSGSTADGHDYVTVTKAVAPASGSGTYSTSIKYTYKDGKLTYVDGTLIPDGNNNVGIWGNPEINWSNSEGDGIMVLPNQRPDSNGAFTFRLSQKNNNGSGASWRSMFRAVSFVEQVDDWHEPLRSDRGSVGFVVASAATPEPLSAAGWYGLNRFALQGGKWNVMPLEKGKAATFDTVRDATGATVEGMSLESAAINGNIWDTNVTVTEAILPALAEKTPRPENVARFTVKGVPYRKYTVLVYATHMNTTHVGAGGHTGRTATKPVKFTTADGTEKSYTYDNAGNLIEGTGDWGRYGNYVSSVGLEGIGVMRIPGVTGETFTVEAGGDSTHCQIQGLQIVEEKEADRIAREGVRMLHRFDFEDTMTVSGKTRVAPVDKGAGGRAFPVITDMGSKDTLPGEGRFGSGGLVSSKGTATLSANSDGLRLRNQMGLGCGAEKGFTLSAFLKNVESADGKGPFSITLGKVKEADGKSFTVQFQKWGSSPSFTLGGFWAGSTNELSATWKTTTQAPPFPVGQWGHYAVTVRPLATSEKANDGEPCVTLDFFYNGQRYGTCVFDGNRGSNKVSMRDMALKEVIVGRSRRSTTPSDANNNLDPSKEANPKTVYLDEVALFDRVISDEGIAWLSSHEAAVPPSETAMTEWGAIPTAHASVNQGTWKGFQVRFSGSGVRHVGALAPTVLPETAELRGATVRWHDSGNNNVRVRRMVLVDTEGKVAAVSEMTQTFARANNHCSTTFPFPEGTEVDFAEDYAGYFIGDHALEVGEAFDESLIISARYGSFGGNTGEDSGFYVIGSNGAIQATDSPQITFTFYTPPSDVTLVDGAAINVNMGPTGRLAADGEYGVVPFLGSAWRALGEIPSAPVTVSDSAGAEGITVTATARMKEDLGDAYHPLLRDTFVDDGGNANRVSVSFTGIPYETYDAYVYMTANQWPLNGPVFVNDDTSAYYTMPEGATEAVASADPVAWGKTGAADLAAQAETTLGVNVMRIAGLSGETLKLTSHRFGGNARGNICAVQIVERKEAQAQSWRGTIERDVADASLTVTSTDGSQTAKLSELGAADSVTLTVEADATLMVTVPHALASLSFDGTGTVTLSGHTLQVKGVSVSSGTLVLKDACLQAESLEIGGEGTLAFAAGTLTTVDALVTGAGRVQVLAGADMTLTNTTNAYIGGTEVLGALRWGGEGTLGTGAVTVSKGGLFDLNGFACAQAVTLDGGALSNSQPPKDALLVGGISFNAGNAGSQYRIPDATAEGLLPQAGALWHQVTTTTGTVDLNAYAIADATSATSIAVSGGDVQVAWSGNHWTNGTVVSNAGSHAFLKSYLDDAGGPSTVTLTVPEIVAKEGYDLYLYSAGDGGNSSRFSARGIVADGAAETFATYLNGTLTFGTDRSGWGSHTYAASNGLAEGQNVMVLRGRDETSLKVNLWNHNGRGPLAALQVGLRRVVYSGSLTLRNGGGTLLGSDMRVLRLDGATIAGTGALDTQGAVVIGGTAFGTRQLFVTSGTLTIDPENDLTQTELAIAKDATVRAGETLGAFTLSGFSGEGDVELGDVSELTLTSAYANAVHNGALSGGAEGMLLTKQGALRQVLATLPQEARVVVEAGTLDVTTAGPVDDFRLTGGILSAAAGAFAPAYTEMTMGSVELTLAGAADEAKPAMVAANDATVANFTLKEGGIVRYDTRSDLSKYFPKGFIPQRATPYKVRLGVDLADELSFPYTFQVLGATASATFEVLGADGQPAPEGTWGASGNTITLNDPSAIVSDAAELPAPKYHWAFDGNLNAAADATEQMGLTGENSVAYEASENGQALNHGTPYGSATLDAGNWTLTAYVSLREMEDEATLLTVGNVQTMGSLMVTRGTGNAVAVWERTASEAPAWTKLLEAHVTGSQGWHFLAVSRSRKYVKLYVDGELCGSAEPTNLIAVSGFQVGRGFGGGTNGHPSADWLASPGAVDDVALYGAVLREGQLAQAMAKTASLWRWHEADTAEGMLDPARPDWTDVLGNMGAYLGDGHVATNMTALTTLTVAADATAIAEGADAKGFAAKELRLSGADLSHRLSAPLEEAVVKKPAGVGRWIVENALTLDLSDAQAALAAHWLSGGGDVKVADGDWLGERTVRNAPEGFDPGLSQKEDGLYLSRIAEGDPTWEWGISVDTVWDALGSATLYGIEGYQVEGKQWNSVSGTDATLTTLKRHDGMTVTGASMTFRTQGGSWYRSYYRDLMMKGYSNGPVRVTFSGLPAGKYEVVVYGSSSSNRPNSPVRIIDADGSTFYTYVDGTLTASAEVPAAGWGQSNYDTVTNGQRFGVSVLKAPATVGADGSLIFEMTDSDDPAAGPGLDWQMPSGANVLSGLGGLQIFRVPDAATEVYMRTVSGDGEWEAEGAWTNASTGATVAAPPVGSTVVITMEGDAVLTVGQDALSLKSMRLFGEGTLALRYDASAWMTEDDYLNIPMGGMDVTLLSAQHDSERVRVWIDGLRYGALAQVTQTDNGATARISLPDSLYPEYGLISVNFWDSTNKVAGGGKINLSGTGTSGYTGYNAKLAYWAQNDGETSGTIDLKSVPFDQRLTDGAEVTTLPGALTWTAYSTWSFNSEKGLLSGFLNDRPLGNTTGKNANLTVDVPDGWGRYTAIIYGSVNSGDLQFTPRKVNGAWYTYADGALSKMETPDDPNDGEWTPGTEGLWGSNATRHDFVEGENLMIVPGLTGDFALEWYATFSGTNLQNRGPVAALQLAQEPTPSLALADAWYARLNGTVAWGDIAWTDGDGVTKEGTPGATATVVLTLEGDATVDASAEAAPAPLTLMQVFGNGHAVRFIGRDRLQVGQWAFLNDATLALGSADETVPEAAEALPRRVRYDYAHEGDYTTTTEYETEFAAGFVGAITPNGGVAEFSGGEVTLSSMNPSATETALRLSGNVRVQTSAFAIGQAEVTLRDKAAVVAERLVGSDGGAGRQSRLTMEDDSMLTVTGSTNPTTSSNTASFLLAHWNGTTNVALRDNANLIAEKAVLAFALDGAVGSFDVEDNATVRVYGLDVYRSGDPVPVNLRGGRVLVGERGLAHRENRQMAFTFDGGAFGAWQDVTLGADAAAAVASVTGNPVFEGLGEAELTLARPEPFATENVGRMTFRSGTVRLSGSAFSALPALETAGGDLILSCTATTPRLRLNGGTVGLEGGFLTASAIEPAATTLVRVPLRERLSEGGYLSLPTGTRLPNLSRVTFELALDPNRPDSESILPQVPLVLGSYSEGDTAKVGGVSVSNNANGALSDWEAVLTDGDAGPGLYVSLEGNEVLRQYTAELRPETAYDLPQSTANGWPFVVFNGNGANSLLGLPEGGLALAHATFTGSGPIRIVARGTQPHTILRGVGYTFSTDVVFDLSAWKDALPELIAGAVRDVPASVCLVSGGVVKAPASVQLSADWGEGASLPQGFVGSVETTADGVYYVVRADRRARTISANFATAAQPLTAPPSVTGVYGVPVSAWNDMVGAFSSSSLRIADVGGGWTAPAVSGEGLTTQLLAYGTQTGTLADAAEPLLRAWLSDSAAQTVRITNIPFKRWRLALIFSNDLAGAEWSAITVNGTRYAMDAEGYVRRDVLPYGDRIPGDEAWGSTDLTQASEAILLGHNALVTDARTDSEITFELPAFLYDRRYAGLAALQLIEAPDATDASESLAFACTIPEEGDVFELNDLTLSGGDGLGKWVNGADNVLTITCDRAVTLSLPESFEAARIVCEGSGWLTLNGTNGGGVAIGALNAARLANLTVGFPMLGVSFTPAEATSRFEGPFDNAGKEYLITRGATLALGAESGITTNYDGVSSPLITVAADSVGTLRRDYPITQSSTVNATNLTFAFGNADITVGTDNSDYDYLVEEGDEIRHPNKYHLMDKTGTWTYTQTGGRAVFNSSSGDQDGMLIFNGYAIANSHGTINISGGRLETGGINAWKSGAIVDLTLSGEGTLALGGGGLRAQSAENTLNLTLREKGTLEATATTLGKGGSGTVQATMEGGRLTTEQAEATFSLPMAFIASSDAPTEVAPEALSTVTLSGSNSGSGAIAVTQGTLAVNNAQSLGSAAVTVKNGATFEARNFRGSGGGSGSTETWDPAMLGQGLQQYWALDADRSCTAGSASYALEGGNYGSVAPSSTAGRFGSGLGDGAGFWVAGAEDFTSFLPGEGDFACAFWMRTDNTILDGFDVANPPDGFPLKGILSRGVVGIDSSTGNRGWGIFVDGEGKVRLDIRKVAGSGSTLAENRLALVSAAPVFGASPAFHHIAWTRSGQTVTLYIDGAVSATGTLPEGFTNIAVDGATSWRELNVRAPNGIVWDNRYFCSGEGFDELAFWSRSLSASEVSALAKANLPLGTMLEQGPDEGGGDLGDAISGHVTFEAGSTCSATTTTTPELPYTARIATTIAFPAGKENVTFMLNGEIFDSAKVEVFESTGAVTFTEEARLPIEAVTWGADVPSGVWKRGTSGPWADGKIFNDGAAVTFGDVLAGTTDRAQVTVEGAVRPGSMAFTAVDKYDFLQGTSTSYIDLSSVGATVPLGAGQTFDVPLFTAQTKVTLDGVSSALRLVGVRSDGGRTASLMGSGGHNASGNTHGVWHPDGMGDMTLSPHAGETQILSPFGTHVAGDGIITVRGQTAPDGSVSGGTVRFGGNTPGTNWNGSFKGSFAIRDGATLDFANTRAYGESGDEWAYFCTWANDARQPLWDNGAVGFELTNGATLRFSACRGVLGGWSQRSRASLIQSEPIVIGKDSRVEYRYLSSSNGQQYTPYGFRMNGDGATLYIGDGDSSGKNVSYRGLFMARGASVIVAGVGEPGDPSDPKTDTAADPVTGEPVNPETYGKLTEGITAFIDAEDGTGFVRWSNGIGTVEDTGVNLVVGTNSLLRVRSGLDYGASARSPETAFVKKGAGRVLFETPIVWVKTIIRVEEGTMGGTTEFSSEDTGAETMVTVGDGAGIEAGLSIPTLSFGREATLFLDPTGATLLRTGRVMFASGGRYLVETLPGIGEIPDAVGLAPIKVMAWDSAALAGSAVFQPGESLLEKGYGIEVRDDGLYVMRRSVYVRHLDPTGAMSKPTSYTLAWYAESSWYREGEDPMALHDYDPSDSEAVAVCFVVPDSWVSDGTTVPMTLLLGKEVSFASVRFVAESDFEANGSDATPLRPGTVYYRYDLSQSPMPGPGETRSFTWVPSLVIETPAGSTAQTLAYVTVSDLPGYTVSVSERTVVVYTAASQPVLNVNFTARSTGDPSWIGSETEPCGVVPFAGVYWNNASPVDLISSQGSYSAFSHRATLFGVEADEEGRAPTAEVTYVAKEPVTVASRRGSGNAGLAAGFLPGNKDEQLPTALLTSANMDAGLAISGGWRVRVDAIPFESYDLYLIFAGNEDREMTYSPVYVKVGTGKWHAYGNANGWTAPVWRNDLWQGEGGLVEGGFVTGSNAMHLRIESTSGAGIEIASIDYGNGDAGNVGLAALQIIRCDDGAAFHRVGAGKWSDALGWQRYLSDGAVTGAWQDATDALPRPAMLPTVSSLAVDRAVTAPYLRMEGSANLSGTAGAINTPSLDLSEMSANAVVTFANDVFAEPPMVHLAPEITVSVPEGGLGATVTNDWRWLCDEKISGTSPTSATLHKRGAGDLVIARKYEGQVRIDDGTLWLSTATDGAYTRSAQISGDGVFGKVGAGDLEIPWNALRTTGAAGVLARAKEGVLYLNADNGELPAGQTVEAIENGTVLFQLHSGNQRRPFNKGIIRAAAGGRFILRGATNLFAEGENRPRVVLEDGMFQNEVGGETDYHLYSITTRGNSAFYFSGNGNNGWRRKSMTLWGEDTLTVESGTLAIWSNNHGANNCLSFPNKSGGNGFTIKKGATVYSEYPIQPTTDNANRILHIYGGGTLVQTKRISGNSVISGGYTTDACRIHDGSTLRWNLGGDSQVGYPSDWDFDVTIETGSRMDGAGRLQMTDVVVEEGGTLSSGLPSNVAWLPTDHKWYGSVPDRFKGEPSDSIRKLRIDRTVDFKDGAILEVNLANPNALDVDGQVTFQQTLTVRLTNLPATLTEARQLTDFAMAPIGSPKITCPEAIALGSEVVLRDGNLWLEPTFGGYVWGDQDGNWGDATWSITDDAGTRTDSIPYEEDASSEEAPTARVVASTKDVALAVDKPDLPTVPEDGVFWGNQALVLSAEAGRTLALTQGSSDPAQKPNGLSVATSLWKIGAGTVRAQVPLCFANLASSGNLHVSAGTLELALPFSKEDADSTYPNKNQLPTGFSAEIAEDAELRFAFGGAAATEDALGFNPVEQTLAGPVTGAGTVALAPSNANAKVTLLGTEDSDLDYDIRSGTLRLAGNIGKSVHSARRVATVAAGARLELAAEGALGWTTNRVIRLEAAPVSGDGTSVGARVSAESDARVRGRVEVSRVASAGADEACVATLGSSRGSMDGDLALEVPEGTELRLAGSWLTPSDATSGALAKRGAGTLRILGEFGPNLPMTVESGAVIVGDGTSYGVANIGAVNNNYSTTADWTVMKGARLEFADTLACQLNGGTLTLASGGELTLAFPTRMTFSSAVTFEDGAVVRVGAGMRTIAPMAIGGEVALQGLVTIDLDALDPETFGQGSGNVSYPIFEFGRTPTGSGSFVLGGKKLVDWARAGWTLRYSGNQLLLESFGGDAGYYAWEGKTAEDTWASSVWVKRGEDTPQAWPDAMTGEQPAAFFADRDHNGDEIPAAARKVDWQLAAQTLAALRVDNDKPGEGDTETSHDYELTANGATSPQLTVAGDFLKTGSASLTVRRPVSFGVDGALRLLGGTTVFSSTLASAGGMFTKPVTLAGDAELVFEGTSGWTLSGLIDGDGTGRIRKRYGTSGVGVSGLLTLASDLSAVTSIDAEDGTVALSAADAFDVAPAITLGETATLSQSGAFTVAGDVRMSVNAEADAESGAPIAPKGTFQWAATAATDSARVPRLVASAGQIAAGVPALNVTEFRHMPAAGHLALDPGHTVLPASATISLSAEGEDKALWMGARTDHGTAFDYAGLTGLGVLGVEPVIDPFADAVWSTNRVVTLALPPSVEGKETTFRGSFMGALTVDGTAIRAGLALRGDGQELQAGEAYRFVLSGASTDAYLGTLDLGKDVRAEVNGQWAGGAAVAEGATLAGSGTVGAPGCTISVPKGAAISGSAYGARPTGSATTRPETIPSTLTVAGTLRMDVGSRLKVLVRKNLIANNAPWVSCVEADALVLPSIVEGGTTDEVTLEIDLDIEEGAYASDVKILGWKSISGARLTGHINLVGASKPEGYVLRQKGDGLYLRRSNARFWMMFR